MNKIIIDELEIIRKKETKDGNVFKARAYGKVINQLKIFEGDIKSINDLKDISGIGKSIKEKIEEIIKTGHIEKISEETREDSEALGILTNIYGVGPAKASALIKDGIRTIEDVRNNLGKFNDKQLLGIKYYEEFLERIPRDEMEKHDKYIKRIVKGIEKDCKVDIVGSYRRGNPDSGDIDVLITFPDNPNEQELFKKVIEKMRKNNYITDVLAEGNHKCLAVCSLPKNTKHRRLDLLLTPIEEYPYALLYFTGSQKFNIETRNQALKHGYSLSEHGLKKMNDKVSDVPKSLKTEKEVLKFLGLKYVPPGLR